MRTEEEIQALLDESRERRERLLEKHRENTKKIYSYPTGDKIIDRAVEASIENTWGCQSAIALRHQIDLLEWVLERKNEVVRLADGTFVFSSRSS